MSFLLNALLQRTPPKGLSGRFFDFGIFLSVFLGTPNKGLPVMAHLAFELALFLYRVILLLPGVLLTTLLRDLDFRFPATMIDSEPG